MANGKLPAWVAALMPEAPDLSALPVTIETGPPKLFGAMLVIGGLVLPVAFYLLLSFIGLVADVPPSWWIVKLAMAGLPLLAIPWGWWIMRSRTAVTIAAETVAYRRTTPFGQTEWEAPLGAYRGVELKRAPRGTNRTSSGPRYVVDLVHERRDRTVRLAHTADRALARQLMQALAGLTGLAARER